MFDNKGEVVKQYEPYFSRTPGYETEIELREHGVTAVVHYDVVGRVVRTELPNGTFSRAEHGGWVQRAWDPNDTVLESEWFAARAGGAMGAAEQRAAALTAAHADTPTTVRLDALGRTVVIEEHAGFAGDPAVPVVHATRLVLDVVGNTVAVIDVRGNTAESRVFGMLGQVLRTNSEDAGWRVVLSDVLGAPVRSWNAREFVTRVQYDALRRPTHQLVTPAGGSEIVVTRTVYGEQVAEPQRSDANLRGRVFRVYDGAGVSTNAAYDFEGNLTAQERRLARVYETTPDWSALDAAVSPTAEAIAALAEPALEAEVFASSSEYDALGRVTSAVTPDGSDTLSTYNEAGLLEQVAVRIRGAVTPTTFVSDFDYDAKGQRQRCVHGNGTVTTYEYDPRTFRLARLRLVRDADSALLQDLRYTYDPVGNITEIRDAAQQTVFFANAVVSADQRFEYDALYRLTRAEGREHASLGQPTDEDLAFGPQPHPNDPSALRRYEQEYDWDWVGNPLQLRHIAGSGSYTRRYVYATAGNRLLRTSAPGEAAEPFSHSYTYDEHGNMTSMPHLAAMAWDHADRLQHCDLGGGGDVWFVYDAAGERVRKVQVNTSGSAVRERIYIGGYEVYRERAANSATPAVERQTLHVGDDRSKLALVETLTVDDGTPVVAPASVQRHQYGNYLGSASLELDVDAAVISYEEYHPFGTTSYAANDAGVEVSAKRYRYIGKERDEETGLYHLGARYYASWLGRWTAADPIGLGDGVNRYAYVHGNPVGMRDPSGTFTAPPEERPPLTQADLTTKSDEEVRSHPTYLDEGIVGVTYHAETKEATIEYEGGESLTIDTSDIRTDPRTRRTPGTVAFGATPEDLNEPEAPSDYIIDDPSGRVVPGEINVENAPNFATLLKRARAADKAWARGVSDAGVAIYSDWKFQALVLSPSPNQLLAPPPASSSLSAARMPRTGTPAPAKTAEIALGLGSHRGKKGSQTLANFARHTKSSWYRQWPEQGIAAPQAGETLMSQSFLERGMQAATRIHFNLEGLTPEAFKAFAKDPRFGYGNISNWELHQVLTTDLAKKATFYGRGGKEMSLEAVRKLYQ